MESGFLAIVDADGIHDYLFLPQSVMDRRP
jgi:hypothetical protein